MDMGTGMQGAQNRPIVAGAQPIAITGDALSFKPNTITLKAGVPVNIRLTALDVEHDLYVNGVGHVAHAKAAETVTAGLQIAKPGTYDFWCTRRGHKEGGMVGTISVAS